MDGLRLGFLGGLDDGVGVEVGLGRGSAPDMHGAVGHLDVEGFGVGAGVDGDGADAEPVAGADDAAGDFAAVGDEDGREHRRLV